MEKSKLLVFASGTQTDGGSGFENLVIASRSGILHADIVAVVSNHENGGVRQRADSLGIPFVHFPSPWNAEEYQRIIWDCKPNFVALSGWLKLAKGLNPRTTINIHPGPLPEFGGPGMYGHHVHEAVLKNFRQAQRRGQCPCSAVSMHFVTREFDKGPLILHYPVEINPGDTPETLGRRVNDFEHVWQPFITNLVVTGQISWDGQNPASLKFPSNYNYLRNRGA